jgi:thioredoxin-like negative regulator of GroEL
MSVPSLADYEHAAVAHLNRRDFAAAATAAWPGARAGWLLGSFVALLADRAGVALELVDAWLARDPNDIECLVQRAECLLALGRRAQALAAAAAAARVGADRPGALDAVGQFQVQANAHREARATYDAALALAPDDIDLLGKRAMVARFLGDFSAAERDYDAILARRPMDASALKERAELRRQTPGADRLAAMQAALAAVAPDSKEASTLHFALAKTFEDQGDARRAWHHLTEGNRLERGWLRYDPGVDRELMARLERGFPNVEPVVADGSGERPIFIVGLPRSGTTLVERMLGSHSEVHPGGELAALSEALAAQVAAARPGGYAWSEFVEALPGIDAARLAADYLARAHARRGEKPRFTDKQPTNFFYCPLILRAFPGACVIHVTRHPLAACLAIYRTRFQGTYPFAYSLEDIGAFYLAYRRLMAHWRAVLPGRMVDVPYEALVRAPEATVRGILAHAGLSFEPACLAFQENPAATTTASAVQVRQPLYDTSVDLWRRYADQLAPLREQLQAGGVTVD